MGRAGERPRAARLQGVGKADVGCPPPASADARQSAAVESAAPPTKKNKSHPPYWTMIMEAVKQTDQAGRGLSSKSIVNYVTENYNVGDACGRITKNVTKNLRVGIEKGFLKGDPRRRVKLGKPEPDQRRARVKQARPELTHIHVDLAPKNVKTLELVHAVYHNPYVSITCTRGMQLKRIFGTLRRKWGVKRRKREEGADFVLSRADLEQSGRPAAIGDVRNKAARSSPPEHPRHFVGNVNGATLENERNCWDSLHDNDLQIHELLTRGSSSRLALAYVWKPSSDKKLLSFYSNLRLASSANEYALSECVIEALNETTDCTRPIHPSKGPSSAARVLAKGRRKDRNNVAVDDISHSRGDNNSDEQLEMVVHNHASEVDRSSTANQSTPYASTSIVTHQSQSHATARTKPNRRKDLVASNRSAASASVEPSPRKVYEAAETLLELGNSRMSEIGDDDMPFDGDGGDSDEFDNGGNLAHSSPAHNAQSANAKRRRVAVSSDDSDDDDTELITDALDSDSSEEETDRRPNVRPMGSSATKDTSASPSVLHDAMHSVGTTPVFHARRPPIAVKQPRAQVREAIAARKERSGRMPAADGNRLRRLALLGQSDTLFNRQTHQRAASAATANETLNLSSARVRSPLANPTRGSNPTPMPIVKTRHTKDQLMQLLSTHGLRSSVTVMPNGTDTPPLAPLREESETRQQVVTERSGTRRSRPLSQLRPRSAVRDSDTAIGSEASNARTGNVSLGATAGGRATKARQRPRQRRRLQATTNLVGGADASRERQANSTTTARSGTATSVYETMRGIVGRTLLDSGSGVPLQICHYKPPSPTPGGTIGDDTMIELADQAAREAGFSAAAEAAQACRTAAPGTPIMHVAAASGASTPIGGGRLSALSTTAQGASPRLTILDSPLAAGLAPSSFNSPTPTSASARSTSLRESSPVSAATRTPASLRREAVARATAIAASQVDSVVGSSPRTSTPTASGALMPPVATFIGTSPIATTLPAGTTSTSSSLVSSPTMHATVMSPMALMTSSTVSAIVDAAIGAVAGSPHFLKPLSPAITDAVERIPHNARNRAKALPHSSFHEVAVLGSGNIRQFLPANGGSNGATPLTDTATVMPVGLPVNATNCAATCHSSGQGASSGAVREHTVEPAVPSNLEPIVAHGSGRRKPLTPRKAAVDRRSNGSSFTDTDDSAHLASTSGADYQLSLHNLSSLTTSGVGHGEELGGGGALSPSASNCSSVVAAAAAVDLLQGDSFLASSGGGGVGGRTSPSPSAVRPHGGMYFSPSASQSAIMLSPMPPPNATSSPIVAVVTSEGVVGAGGNRRERLSNVSKRLWFGSGGGVTSTPTNDVLGVADGQVDERSQDLHGCSMDTTGFLNEDTVAFARQVHADMQAFPLSSTCTTAAATTTTTTTDNTAPS